MRKRQKVLVARSAQLDLADVHEFISRDNPAAAARLRARILASFRLLAEFPKAGRQTADETARLQPVPGTNYVILYELGPAVVHILRILHGAMRWPPDEEE